MSGVSEPISGMSERMNVANGCVAQLSVTGNTPLESDYESNFDSQTEFESDYESDLNSGSKSDSESDSESEMESGCLFGV